MFAAPTVMELFRYQKSIHFEGGSIKLIGIGTTGTSVRIFEKNFYFDEVTKNVRVFE